MDRNVTHATFTLERSYPVPPARVFAAYLDGHEQPAWREQGTADQLEALAAELKAEPEEHQ
jgi:uncharacterized protein YndB with AHSA1/START domain